MDKKVMKRMLVFFLAICMIFGNVVPVQAAKKKTVKAKTVKLNKTIYTLKKGKSVTLKATISPKNATTKTITWSTSNKKIATVSKKGKVTAKKNGTAKITAKVKGTSKKAVCKIIVGTPVTKVSLNKKTVTLEPGKTVTVKASITPKKATTKSVAFASSNKKVAAVNSKGKITAKAVGTAKITATAKDGSGKKATVTVKVKKAADTSQSTGSDSAGSSGESGGTDTSGGSGGAGTSGGNEQPESPKQDEKVTVAEVSSDSEVKEALENSDLEELTIKNSGEITIEKGEYKNVSLIVDAPDGHIENYAEFKDISIKAISCSTFVENAVGNTINYSAASGTIQVAEGAVAVINVVQGAETLNLINNGSITNLGISTDSNVNISGDADGYIPVAVEKEAKESTVSTSRNLDVKADAAIRLNISSGAEDTIVEAADSSAVPSVSGLGRIEVKINDTGDMDNIVAENSASSETQLQKVSLSGSIQNTNNEAMNEADVYVIPYSSNITENNISEYLSSAAAHVQSNERGTYETGEIGIGNYYLLVQKDDYADVIETLILTSASQEEYNVLSIVMIAKSEGTETGTLTGRIIDAQTEDTPADAGITLRLRAGRNNISGTPLKTTTIQEDGEYTFENVPLGQYTIEVYDTREDSSRHCISTSFGAVVSSTGTNEQDSSVTFILESEQVQFVLSWGNEDSGASSDLDSHLVGPDADGTGQFHTWFSNETYYTGSGYYDENDEYIYEGGSLYADLDRDDIDWEGPETTTIYQRTDGIYSFYIHDFSNRRDGTSDQMSRSSAVVKVLIGSKEVASYNVPNKAGNLWYVCDFDSTTNKIIPKNTVSSWEGELEDIGIDVLEKYRGYLGDYISKATVIAESLSDETQKSNARELLAEAQNVYATSEDQNEVMEQYTILKEWISSFSEAAEIMDVTGDDIYSYYTYGDISSGIAYLEIEGYTESMPDFTVKFTEGTQYEIIDSDDEDYSKVLVVTTSAGFICRYYIEYYLSSSLLSIGYVTADDENGDSLLYNWYTTWEYEDEEEYQVLVIEGCTDTMPNNIKIEAESDRTSIAVTPSDKEGYDRMVVLSYGDSSRTYYIQYKLSEEFVLGIQSVSATTDSGDAIISEWSIERDYEEDDIWILSMWGATLSMPDNCEIIPRASGTTADIRGSDRSDYEKMAVLTNGNMTRTYYIQYNTNYEFYVLNNIDDCYDAGSLVDYYEMQWPWDSGSNVPVLIVYGYGTELSENCLIGTLYSGATAELKESDNPSYDQMIVVTYNDEPLNIYVDYQFSDTVLGMFSVYDGETELSKKMTWDEDNGYGIITLRGYTASVGDELKFEAYRSDLDISVSDSDRDGYAQKVDIAYQNISRTYYVSYQVSEETCNISELESDSLLNYEINCDDDTYILDIYTSSAISLNDLKIVTEQQGAEAVLQTSDQSGYDGMIVVTYLTASRTYYVRCHIIESISAGEKKTVSLEGTDVRFSFTPAETGDYCFYTSGDLDTIGVLYSDEFNELKSNDDSGEDLNFSITYSCTAGTTYYISVDGYDNDTGEVILHVEKAE